jgi:hypothetical protein
VVEDSRRVAGGKRLKDFPDRYHGHVRATRETIDSGSQGQFEFDQVVPQGTVIDLSVTCERGQMCGDLQTGARHDAKAPALGINFVETTAVCWYKVNIPNGRSY